MLTMAAGMTPPPEPAAAPTTAEGVRLLGLWFQDPVRRAVLGATARLGQPSCNAVVLFYDGSNESPCRRPSVYAFTVPGVRAVRVCPSLGWLAAGDPERAESIVIHEVLHTLGLEENPPSSEEITARVEKRCRR
jgi:hypothetical protein